MITNILKSLFGDKSLKDQKLYKPFVDDALSKEQAIKACTDDQLREKTQGFRALINQAIQSLETESQSLQAEAKNPNLSLDDKQVIFEKIDAITKEIDEKIEGVLLEILPEAFAVVKETAFRWANHGKLVVSATDFDKTLASRKDGITIQGDQAIWSNEWTAAGNKVQWNMVHYDVQLMGGAVLHKGNIAEMQTGEGKTLVATLPVYLNALSGKGVHIVTVNDYLAKRDSEWMGPLYQFHLLSVDCIDKHQPNSEERRMLI